MKFNFSFPVYDICIWTYGSGTFTLDFANRHVAKTFLNTISEQRNIFRFIYQYSDNSVQISVNDCYDSLQTVEHMATTFELEGYKVGRKLIPLGKSVDKVEYIQSFIIG